MHFMIIRKADTETEAGVMPTTELIEKMTEYNEKLAKAGVLRGGEGLLPSSKGARITFSGGKPTVLDGPFAEAKELIAGFTLIEVASYEEALGWVRQWPSIDGHGNVELELRQVASAADFGAAFTPDLQEREDAMRLTTESRAKM